MADERDDDETRTLIGELQEALGGEPDMTAASGLGPRDRGHGDDVIAGTAGKRDAGRGGGGGGGGRSTATASGAAPGASTTRPAPSAAPGGGAGRSTGGGGRNLGAIIAALLVGLIVGGGFAALLLGGDDSSGDDFGGTLDSSRYQAVIQLRSRMAEPERETAS